jgi:hypothetical protein
MRVAEEMSGSSPEVNDCDRLAPNADIVALRGRPSIFATPATRNLGGRETRKGI